MDRKQELKELRLQGLTYSEIGKKFGISRQRVHSIIGATRTRKSNTDIEKIIYEGIYQLFVDDKKMTFQKLARIFIGHKIPANYNTRIRQAVIGEKNRRFSIYEITNICKYAGKPFEEIFKLRAGKEHNT